MAPNTNHPLAGKQIIVCGAGIGGLAFAIALAKLWPTTGLPSALQPSVTIYEREDERQPQREGYAISLRSDALSGGVQALQRLGLLDQILDVSITGRQTERGGFCFWDKEWRLLMKIGSRPVEGLPASGVRITRVAARQVLIDAADAVASVRWGEGCMDAKRLDDGRVEVQLSTGRRVECDLLIVADGASSKIRQSLRPDDTLQFTGAISITGISTFDDGDVPAPVNRDWGVVMGGNGLSLFVSPIDEKRALWAMSRVDTQPREIRSGSPSEDDSRALLDEVLDRGSVFAEPFQTLVNATDPAVIKVFNVMDKQPFDHGTLGEGGQIVFIGDANHAVSPFAGNGANLALMDAWDLAEQLCKTASIHEAVQKYDDLSLPRVKMSLRFSHIIIPSVHSKGWMNWLFQMLIRAMGILFTRRAS